MKCSLTNKILRNRKLLFNSEYLSNITFVVVGNAEERLFGHVPIMKTASEMFEAIVARECKTKHSEILITDVEGPIFLEMLRFIYTDEVKVNKDNFIGLYHAANKYLMDDLKNFLLSSINEESVMKVLQQNYDTHYFNEVEYVCFRIIMANPEEIFKKEDFYKINGWYLDVIMLGLVKDQCDRSTLKKVLLKWETQNNHTEEDIEEEIIKFASILTPSMPKIPQSKSSKRSFPSPKISTLSLLI